MPHIGYILLAVSLATAGTARGKEQKTSLPSYGEARSFLEQHTELIELTNDAGARVAVAPAWQGRVMTSTCSGPEGPSFGFINRKFIEAGKPDARFNDYGGEDRLWLGPEGGQFGLWFEPGAKQTPKNWRTPPALGQGTWTVASRQGAAAVCMTAHWEFRNASSTPFSLDVTRNVRLLSAEDFRQLFGVAAANALAQRGAKMVAYETADRVTNRGPAFARVKGLVSIRILGMMNAGPKTVMIVPYKSGPEVDLGPVVTSDFFGAVPDDRLNVASEAVLFRADAGFRSKIGVSQRRVHNVLGAIDFEAGVLTLVQFTMPQDPARCDYPNNLWELPQARPFAGDVVAVYNDGPDGRGRRRGAFYEIESLSPAKELITGESLDHRWRTIHIQADAKTLHELAKQTLGVDLETVRKAMSPK